MAVLDANEATRLVRAPANKTVLVACAAHDNRLRFHAIPAMERAEAEPGVSAHLAWVGNLLTEAKATQYAKLLTYPVPTGELVAEMLTELARALSARNRFLSLEFAVPELLADFNQYRAAFLRDEEFVRTSCLQAAASEIHSFAVVDMAAEAPAAGNRPAPFVYLVPVEQVVDVAVKQDGQCEYLIFHPGPTEADKSRVVILDDASYRVWERAEGGTWTELVNNPHQLGYCPARTFWTDLVKPTQPLRRRGPLTNVLALLDQYVFWYTSDTYAESYASYPILWEMKNAGALPEGMHTGPEGTPCINGRIRFTATVQVPKPGGLPGETVGQTQDVEYLCPRCAAGAGGNGVVGVGPGSRVTVRVPEGMADKATGFREPVGFVVPPTDALKFVSERVAERRRSIFRAVVGFDGEQRNNQARNVTDVQGDFEGRTNALTKFKSNLERLHTWFLETVARLRYGPEFTSLTLSYGDEFYLKTVAELETQLGDAMEAGLPQADLSATAATLGATRNRENPEALLRDRILRELEPYRWLTIDQVLNLPPALSDSRRQRLKIRFTDLVDQFEREELPVTQFGSKLPWGKKLARILETLLEYVDGEATEQRAAEGSHDPGNAGGNPGAGNGKGNQQPGTEGGPAAGAA